MIAASILIIMKRNITVQSMNNITGESIDGLAHLKQSVNDILTTPIGSRVMRRDYGCGLVELLDSPIDASLIAGKPNFKRNSQSSSLCIAESGIIFFFFT